MARYDFLVETYDTERLKTLSVWSQFRGSRHGVSARASRAPAATALKQTAAT